MNYGRSLGSLIFLLDRPNQQPCVVHMSIGFALEHSLRSTKILRKDTHRVVACSPYINAVDIIFLLPPGRVSPPPSSPLVTRS